MAAPTLNDYEYQYKDAGVGVLLNQATPTMPFWDIEKIGGLSDFPELSFDILDLDGQHGGYVTGTYFRHRMIILEGLLYSAASDVDTNVELLKATILPDGIDYPLYWKHPNKTQRYFMGKPVGFASDVEAGRRTGKVPFQLQVACTDPRSYIDIASVAWTTGVNYTFTNAGNTASNQLISITATSTTTATITVSNQTQSRSFVFSTPITSTQVITIDPEKLIVKVNGVIRNVTMVLTGTDWPTANTGLNTWRVTSNVGNGTSVPKSAFL
jgi:phage-related protein